MYNMLFTTSEDKNLKLPYYELTIFKLHSYI